MVNVSAKTLRPILVKNASRKSYLMTDESAVCPKIGDEFAGPRAVNHSADEYVRTGGFHHTNTGESHFTLLKRGLYGTYHAVSEAYLHRYLAEFDFWGNRKGLIDSERAAGYHYGAPRQSANERVDVSCKLGCHSYEISMRSDLPLTRMRSSSVFSNRPG